MLNVNADPAELDKFGELAHRWWDPNSEFKPLHDINPLRLDWIDNAIGLRGKRVLDVGCGYGGLALLLARRRPDLHITGVDMEASALDSAAQTAAGGAGTTRLLVISMDANSRRARSRRHSSTPAAAATTTSTRSTSSASPSTASSSARMSRCVASRWAASRTTR